MPRGRSAGTSAAPTVGLGLHDTSHPPGVHTRSPVTVHGDVSLLGVVAHNHLESCLNSVQGPPRTRSGGQVPRDAPQAALVLCHMQRLLVNSERRPHAGAVCWLCPASLRTVLESWRHGRPHKGPPGRGGQEPSQQGQGPNRTGPGPVMVTTTPPGLRGRCRARQPVLAEAAPAWARRGPRNVRTGSPRSAKPASWTARDGAVALSVSAGAGQRREERGRGGDKGVRLSHRDCGHSQGR